MAYDGFVTMAITSELNKNIKNGKINKVFEPSKNNIILGIYANGVKYALNICIEASSCRLHLTTTSKPNPINAPNFCMLLRKYLIGSKITSIDSYNLDRIIILELECYNELNDLIKRKLIVELMGKHSNIILVNENDIIIDSIRHIDSNNEEFRSILPAHPYELPSSNKTSFLNLSFDSFYDIVSNTGSGNLENILINNFNGCSKVFTQYILNYLNINVTNYTKSDLNNLYNYIINLINDIKQNSVSCIKIDSNSKSEYVLNSNYNASNLNVNFFIDDYYSYKEEAEYFENYKANVLKLILGSLKKYTKRLENINSKLAECENMNLYKLYGELITSNLYKIKNVNTDKIELENYYDNNKIISIPLDKKISPSNNAKQYFKKYNKLKNTLDIVSTQKIETKKELDYIESIIYSIESAKTISDIDQIYIEISENILKKETPNIKKRDKDIDSLNNPIELNIDGYTILVGKNNKQNDYITFKLADKRDIWFHTQDVHGSHVILKTNQSDVNDDILQKCASIAAFYSKANKSSKVAVDYTLVKNVKKPSKSKPGMVIFTNYKTIYASPQTY